MKICPDCTATYPDDYVVCPKDGAPLHESTLWQIGTVVRGKYRIQQRLGEGGMAMVYKAHHQLLDEPCALKVIKPELARDEEFMKRFKNEAIMARKLNHPYAVRVDDLDIAEDGLPFIAMELVVGDTLKTLVQRVGPLPVSLVLDIASNVCQALDAAHKLGLIHRDIKPENIVLIAQRNGPPVAKILDFGISHLRAGSASGKGLTQTGMVIGTPEYMSPEQTLGKRDLEIDGRSDIYSLGIVMYRMLTGELPFKADSTVEMILQHLKTVPTPPQVLKPELGIPDAVSAIVMKALEKDRDKRFATGEDMAAAIKKARGSATLVAPKVEWEALSLASATFGTEKGTPPPGRTATPRPAKSGVGSSASSPTGKTAAHRSSARIGPPSREFPTRLVMTLVAVAVLIVGAYGGLKYLQPWLAAKVAARQAASNPVNSPAVSTPDATKPGAADKGASAAAPNGRPAARANLNYQGQAKVRELNSLAGIYYRQGGCEKALPTYQRVLEIDPGNPRAYAAVQSCYAKARKGLLNPPIPATTPDAPQQF